MDVQIDCDKYETTDGKQNLITSIFLIKFSQRYIAIIVGVACNLGIPHAIYFKRESVLSKLVGSGRWYTLAM